MDDELFDPKKNDFSQEIGDAEKFGMIEEEERGKKKVKKYSKVKICLKRTLVTGFSKVRTQS